MTQMLDFTICVDGEFITIFLSVDILLVKYGTFETFCDS